MNGLPPPYDQLAARFARVYKHQRKWARRTAVTCFRIYEKDLPDHPLIVDWYDGEAVVWAFDRTRNETEADEVAWLDGVTAACAVGLGITVQQVHLKKRRKQAGRQSDGPGQYEKVATTGGARTVSEQGLNFEVNLDDYLDTGLFLDHRPTRAAVRSEAAGRDVLNLFAYTGAFTCYAAAGDARTTTTVDLSNTYLAWAERNLALNGFRVGPQHRIVRADCLRWLATAASAGPTYDLIVCDPPTFSDSTAMEKPFIIDRDHPWLLERCAKLLRPGGILYFSTNSRAFALEGEPPGLSGAEISATSVPEDFRNRKIHRCWRWEKKSP